MTSIAITSFKGELPALTPRLLQPSNAQAARNVNLRKGSLRAENAPLPVLGIGGVINPSSIYRYPFGNNGAGFWFAWGDGQQVDAAKSPLAKDAWSRVYWTGDSFPKMAPIGVATQGAGPYPSGFYRLGIPAPASAPLVKEPAGSEAPPATTVGATYVVTYVSAYGEEGPPSSASNIINRWDGTEDQLPGKVNVQLPPAPNGPYNIVSKRLYRSESGGEFLYLADFPVAQGSWVDAVNSDELGIACPSLTWDMPDPAMVGLVEMPNGIFAGFFDNTLCFCEPYYPHAWPIDYQISFPDKIVGIGVTTAGLVVATTGRPRLVTGTTPSAMTAADPDADRVCASRGSVVDMGEYVVYASTEGLVAISGGEPQLITDGVLTPEQWQALNPASIHACRYEGRYLAFYDGGCFALAPGEGIEFIDAQAANSYYDIAASTLYLIQGSTIAKWRGGAAMTYRWRSKVFEFPPGSANFSCGKVVAAAFPVRLRVIADGATALDAEVGSNQMFRLPPGYAGAREWQVEASGSSEVFSIQIANTPSELT
ncbi:hypothetical protein [Pseudomonas sp. 5P_3.1_Bac2]|uniref:hypothetical protein n=1 Tax=Pseudomonas sp. 5P_3.1_Bac2 TaxID=2971617 RepID=UPI0021CA0A31|nr:hypothetical protein [Pseudomonas sp. 5P_3.1_Bac2]MCU1717314.1 hypothetical protein [Pseudomonas sp. 5P_3.1_Bac2]